MAFSTALIVRVAEADVAFDMAFPQSVRYWHANLDESRPWPRQPGDAPCKLDSWEDGVFIDGHCLAEVSAPDGGVIHIAGDLGARMEVGGHLEIVIAGNVRKDARIDATGFCNVYIGGDLEGTIVAADSAKIWIDGDCRGLICTGSPRAVIHIEGSYRGKILPLGRPSLLHLEVNGFAAHERLMKIFDCGYVSFNGSIQRSDVPPGLYPRSGQQRKINGGNSFNRWSVRCDNRQAN